MNNKIKTVLFASLIVAMILPFAVMDIAAAEQSDELKTDFDLMKEADNIMKIERNFEYDENGNNENGINNTDQERHQEIIKELNSRGMFHISQEIVSDMVGYEVVNTQSINTDNNPIEATMFSPVQDNVETMDRTCCGNTHNKKLSVRSGMEWPNSVFSWVIHRVEGPWSPFTSNTDVSISQITGNESNVKLYVQTKNDHPITTAAYSITSEILIKDQRGNWVTLQPAFVKAYPSVYYSIVNTIKGDALYTESTLPGPTKHQVTITMTAIS